MIWLYSGQDGFIILAYEGEGVNGVYIQTSHF